MRLALLALVAACGSSPDPESPDASPAPPEAPLIQFVEDGAYDLSWDGDEPDGFEGCDELSVLAVGNPEVEFLGAGCDLSIEVEWRGNCLCTDDWCLCPNVRSLYAEIGGVPVRAYRR